MKRRKGNKFLLLLLLLLGIGIGFAAIATTLKINGTANISKPTWSVYWANPVVTNGSVTNTLPTIEEDVGDPENTKISWTATLALPGDYYEFTIDAVNAGSVDAMITKLEPTVTDGTNQVVLPSYIDYTVTYDDGSDVALNQLLAASSSQKYKVRIYYDIAKMTTADLDAMPAGGLSYEFELDITYGVATNDIYRPPFRVGQYLILEPDAEYATTSYAGFDGSTPTADQTLWRVINVAADGKVEAVSEYSSTNMITISGSNGYKNAVAGLNDLASCYAKSGYTVATREMGYDGQAGVIADPYYFNGSVYYPPSTTTTSSPTSGNGEEYSGGILGDTLYLRDYQLVKTAYNGSLAAYSNEENGSSYYCLASRYYYYFGSNRFDFDVRIINGGSLSTLSPRYYMSKWYNSAVSCRIRPIITLRSGITIASGEGSQSNPYILN